MVRVLVVMVLLGGLILTHELGHYAAMRAYGVPAEEVAVGFGPELAELGTLDDGAKFKINWIPLGGYVKSKRFVGMHAESPRGAIASVVVAVAGPLANILTAWIMLWLVMMTKIRWRQPLSSLLSALGMAFQLTFELGLGFFLGLLRHPIRTISRVNGIVYILFGKNRMMGDIGKAIREKREMEFGLPTDEDEAEDASPESCQDGADSQASAETASETEKKDQPPTDRPEKGLKRIRKETLSGWGVACMVLASVAAFLGGLNLIPVLPLDGGRVAMAVLHWTAGPAAVYWYGWVGLVLIGLLVLGVTINDIRCIVQERRKPKKQKQS